MEEGGASDKIPLVGSIDFPLSFYYLPVIPPVTILTVFLGPVYGTITIMCAISSLFDGDDFPTYVLITYAPPLLKSA